MISFLLTNALSTELQLYGTRYADLFGIPDCPASSLIIIFMQRGKTIYFRKTHKLYISNIVLQNKLHYLYRSEGFANSEEVLSTLIVQPNKILDIVTVDQLDGSMEHSNSEV
jgi:hypothetical protein